MTSKDTWYQCLFVEPMCSKREGNKERSPNAPNSDEINQQIRQNLRQRRISSGCLPEKANSGDGTTGSSRSSADQAWYRLDQICMMRDNNIQQRVVTKAVDESDKSEDTPRAKLKWKRDGSSKRTGPENSRAYPNSPNTPSYEQKAAARSIKTVNHQRSQEVQAYRKVN